MATAMVSRRPRLQKAASTQLSGNLRSYTWLQEHFIQFAKEVFLRSTLEADRWHEAGEVRSGLV